MFHLVTIVLNITVTTAVISPVGAYGADLGELMGMPFTEISESSTGGVEGRRAGQVESVLAQTASSIVVDHHSVALFELIPEEYIQAAEALNMFYADRSVGSNINEGLDCLDYLSDEDAPFGCRRIEHRVPAFNVDPSELDWYRPGGYNRDNWDFLFWPQPGCDGWSGKAGCFFNAMDSDIDQYDVVSYQFSYLAVMSGSTIEDQPGGFFWDNPDRLDVYDLETYEAQHADKVFIYWTTSLARGIGTEESDTFNEQMRQYATSNGKILFDVADILSHDPSGNLCYDNRDGVPYDNGNKSENHPDDGVDRMAICQHYTTEVDGGHLGSVSVGKIRVAKAFWVLMARIAGWEPSPPIHIELFLPLISR
jgi:hypothetical protein